MTIPQIEEVIATTQVAVAELNNKFDELIGDLNELRQQLGVMLPERLPPSLAKPIERAGRR